MERKQAAETGVRHLRQRELTRPPGDHRDRGGAQGEDHDGGVEEEARGRDVDEAELLVVPGDRKGEEEQTGDAQAR